jgi:hypothetical protein
MPPIPRFDLVYDLVDNHEGRRRILVENLENIFDMIRQRRSTFTIRRPMSVVSIPPFAEGAWGT